MLTIRSWRGLLFLAFACSACTVSGPGGTTPGASFAPFEPSVSAAAGPGTGAGQVKRPAEPEPSGEPESLNLHPWPAEEFWLQVSPGGESLQYSSLKSITESSDAVVVGRILSIGEGRPVDDPTGGGYGTIAFSIESLVAGEIHPARSDTVNVEFFMPDARLYPRFAVGFPKDRILLFLRNKAAEALSLGLDPDGPLAGENFYRIASDQGYLRSVDGRIVPPVGATDAWLTDLAGHDFDATVAALKG